MLDSIVTKLMNL